MKLISSDARNYRQMCCAGRHLGSPSRLHLRVPYAHSMLSFLKRCQSFPSHLLFKDFPVLSARQIIIRFLTTMICYFYKFSITTHRHEETGKKQDKQIIFKFLHYINHELDVFTTQYRNIEIWLDENSSTYKDFRAVRFLKTSLFRFLRWFLASLRSVSFDIESKLPLSILINLFAFKFLKKRKKYTLVL